MLRLQVTGVLGLVLLSCCARTEPTPPPLESATTASSDAQAPDPVPIDPPELAPATSTQRPLTELPAGADAAPGRLSLWADFHRGAPGDDTLLLYLVNRTGGAVAVPAQDGDVYAKLEAKDPTSGQWVRAQTHRYSDCGLSYAQLSLENEHFIVVPGWRPGKGMHARVRYRLYEGLDLASNENDGFLVPAEVTRARHDSMAIRRGGVGVLREVLLESAQPADPEARGSAFGRLSQLRGPDVVRLLEDLLGQELEQHERRDALDAYRAAAPDELSAYLLRTLATGPDTRAESLLAEMRFVEPLEDQRWIDHLLERAQRPSSPGLAFSLEILGRYKTPAVAELLVAVQNDNRYAEPIRILARYLHEQSFGDAGVDVRISPRGSRSEGHATPVLLDITLRNSSDRRIDLSYTRPTDVLSLYVSRAARSHTFLPPKPGVAWFTPPGAGPRSHASLVPGGEHVITLAAMDYFELPRGEDGLTVWASVRIDGLQRVAKLGDAGSSISPR